MFTIEKLSLFSAKTPPGQDLLNQGESNDYHLCLKLVNFEEKEIGSPIFINFEEIILFRA
jgi:hypothetical protein